MLKSKRFDIALEKELKEYLDFSHSHYVFDAYFVDEDEIVVLYEDN